MNDNLIKQNVYNYYEKGHHCAESITRTLLDIFDKDSSVQAGKCASGFCGGIGRCTKDICGALSGGVIALSSLFGREKGNKDINKLCEMAVKFRECFINEFGSTVCSTLKDEVEKRNDLENCSDLTANAAVILYKVIEEYNG